MAVTVNGTNGLTFNDGTTQATAWTPGWRNRIINGDMRIDQRNAGASVTINDNSAYTLDRWFSDDVSSGSWTIQRSTTAPAGFSNSLLVTITAADTSLGATERCRLLQFVEGFNIADLAWGTASAASVTLSFWVRSSVTGTFSGSVLNSGETRAYPFTYTINSANTFEYKTITIPGETSGTWVTDNGVGIRLCFSLGLGSNFLAAAGSWATSARFGATGETPLIGTNGATFYITGVQLEKGSTATSFEQVEYGEMLRRCQRYYFKTTGGATNSSPLGVGFVDTATTAVVATYFPVEMRTDPTAVETNGTAADYRVRRAGGSTVCSAVPAFFSTTKNSGATTFTVASGLTAGQGAIGGTVSANVGFLAWSAEL